ncbi:MAG TPA: TRAP transporter small permease [Paracoccus sp.]|nr:TRAP transporter small permease [Paracoccus sp. (in: a-proteobacteria)]
MVLLEASIRALSWVNGHLLRIGYGIGIAAITMMVAVTLVQVFFRYVLNNALPWPDEAARFGMLWMTGLMAPIAFRRGGFVAIDILIFALPRAAAAILNIVLLAVSLTVLIVSLKIGWSEVTGLGGRFASASLYLPTSVDFSTWQRLPRSWMMAALPVGIVLLILVNVELILRNLAQVLGLVELPPIPHSETEGAE